MNEQTYGHICNCTRQWTRPEEREDKGQNSHGLDFQGAMTKQTIYYKASLGKGGGSGNQASCPGLSASSCGPAANYTWLVQAPSKVSQPKASPHRSLKLPALICDTVAVGEKPTFVCRFNVEQSDASLGEYPTFVNELIVVVSQTWTAVAVSRRFPNTCVQNACWEI